jgi:pimeloyl-ACP methyl ester carboxylesterase
MKSGFAPVNGLQMYYQIHGSATSAKPLVLIHGGGSTIESNWTRLIPILAPTRQLIAIEVQAHGRTKDIDRPFTFQQDADDVAALLKHLNIPKADIFGFSNGGQTALQIGIRHPNVVNKLVVASIGYTREGFYPWFWDVMKAGTFEMMPQPLKDAFLAVNPDRDQLYTMWKRDYIRMNEFKSWTDDDIKKIKSPALVVMGDNEIVMPEHAVHMYRLIPGSRLIIMPCGHGDYLGELTTGNTDTRLHETFAGMVTSFLDAPIG